MPQYKTKLHSQSLHFPVDDDPVLPQICRNEVIPDTHLKAMDDSAFNSYLHTFFRCIGDKDSFLPRFLAEDEIIREKGVHEIRRIYPGEHDWNVWRPCFADFAQMIFQ